MCIRDRSRGKTGNMLLTWMQTLVKKNQAQRDTLGDRGENLAARHLRNLGYRIITRNFRCPLGEIDIVARDGNTLVFCEVKTRAYEDDNGVGISPEDQVNTVKRHQISKAARYYLSRYG